MYIKLRGRTTIKEHIDTLIDYVELDKNFDALTMVESLKTDIIRHYNLEGKSKDLLNILMNMRWALTHYSKDSWRKQKMYNLTIMLRNTLSDVEVGVDLKTRLQNMYNDIKEDFKKAIFNGDPRDIDALSDDLVGLQSLSDEMAKQGPEVYQEYRLMMGDAGQCDATLPKLNPKKKGEMWNLNNDALKSLPTNFGFLYTKIDKMLATLSEPAESKELRKKDTSESLSDLEEDQIKAMRSEAQYLLVKERNPIDKIGEKMDMTIDEVCEILGIENDYDDDLEEKE